MNVEVLRDLIKKCDIYFEDQLISGELLLRVFTDFLSEEADRKTKAASFFIRHPRVLMRLRSPGRHLPSLRGTVRMLSQSSECFSREKGYSAERNVESLSALKRMKTEKNGR